MAQTRDRSQSWRHAPEGEVPLAPNLSVTFSQPMVAVSSQEEAAESVRVETVSAAPGQVALVGAKTLVFDPVGRFPMATHYSVTVPAGTKSAAGGTMSAAKSWAFKTPPPSVSQFYPEAESVQRRDTLMFAEFDQRIDPAAILRALSVSSRQELSEDTNGYRRRD